MKNSANPGPSSGISYEQARMSFFSDPASTSEVRQLLDRPPIERKRGARQSGCTAWSSVFPASKAERTEK